jgi:hypothetical protein
MTAKRFCFLFWVIFRFCTDLERRIRGLIEVLVRYFRGGKNSDKMSDGRVSNQAEACQISAEQTVLRKKATSVYFCLYREGHPVLAWATRGPAKLGITDAVVQQTSTAHRNSSAEILH